MAPSNRRNARTSRAGGHDHSTGSSSTTREIPPAEGCISTRVGRNPYQYKGTGKAFEAKAVEEGLYLTVDIPGVPDNGAEVWMEENELFFSGVEQKEAEFETIRVYGGCIDLGSDSGEISEMKIDMKNGVLRIILVGCTIQPELTNLGVPSSSTRPFDPSQLDWHWTKDGKRMIGFRNFSIWNLPDESRGIYPFQLSGSLESCESTIVSSDLLFMRIDMPDVPSNKKLLQFRDDIAFYGGEGEKWSEHDDEGCRGYFGNQRLQCGCCKYVGVQSELKNGVLRMLLKKKRIKGRKPFCNCNSKK